MVGKLDMMFKQGGLLWGGLLAIYLILLFSCGREDETLNERGHGSSVTFEHDNATAETPNPKKNEEKPAPLEKVGDEPDKDKNDEGEAITFTKSFEEVTVLGEVFGTVKMTEKTSLSLTLEFFRDKEADNGGLSIGSTTTNASNGRFNFTIPSQHIDNKTHTLYIYAKVDSERLLIDKAGINYTAYKVRDAAYYTNTVQPVLAANCGGCHGSRALEDAYYNLLSPAPNKGGSATNNQLFRKPSGQLNHGGGNRCGANSTPCDLIRTWWEREFQN